MAAPAATAPAVAKVAMRDEAEAVARLAVEKARATNKEMFDHGVNIRVFF